MYCVHIKLGPFERHFHTRSPSLFLKWCERMQSIQSWLPTFHYSGLFDPCVG